MKEVIEIKNYGFKKPVIEVDQYIFGASVLPEENLQSDGQWDPFIPERELQKRNGVETYNCTAFGTNSALEFYTDRKYKKKENWSDRWVGIIAETKPPGNSPHTVAEMIRKTGLIEEAKLPFGENIDTLEKYYSFESPTIKDACYKTSMKFLQQYDFKHDWVLAPDTKGDKKEILKKALKHSALGVAVRAWQKRGEYFFKLEGEDDTHWCVLYGYEEGQYWKVFDSYDNTLKKLEWEYYFEFAKRYFLELLPVPVEKPVAKSRWQEFWEAIIQILTAIFSKKIT